MLETERLKLIPINTDHLEGLFLMWSDYSVIEYTNALQIKTREECAERIKKFMTELRNRDYDNTFSMLLGDEVIGLAGFTAINFEKGEYYIYYLVRPEFWGKGLGFEAAEAVLRYMLNDTNATRIEATSAVENVGSIKIIERLGFTKTHVVEKEFTKNNKRSDVVHYEMKNRKNLFVLK